MPAVLKRQRLPNPDAIPADLQNLLDRAARLKRRIDFRNENTRELIKRLDNLKKTIAQLVPGSPEAAGAASETKGGGMSWTLGAVGGATVRVTKPANKLLGRIDDFELIAKLRRLCGRAFTKLFVVHYTCMANFRALCWQSLEKDIADEVIELCEEESQPSVTIS